jgi:hypothetical protein
MIHHNVEKGGRWGANVNWEKDKVLLEVIYMHDEARITLSKKEALDIATVLMDCANKVVTKDSLNLINGLTIGIRP